MRAVILAAGRGARMGDLTRDVPKCLVPVAGRTLLERQIAALRGAGIDSIGVVRGYLAHLIDGRGLEFVDNPRWAETNMVTSLACAAKWLCGEPVIVSYADIFYPSSAVTALIDAGADMAIAYDPHWRALWNQRFADPLSDAETFRLDGSRVVEIGNRADRLDEIGGQYMGLLKFTPVGWHAVERYLTTRTREEQDRLDMTGLLSALIQCGQWIEGVRVVGEWGELDNGDDLALYERLAAQGRLAFSA
jgi:L-glutamine-phosphate cytidylyltransferase